jgi:hypothetical protein
LAGIAFGDVPFLALTAAAAAPFLAGFSTAEDFSAGSSADGSGDGAADGSFTGACAAPAGPAFAGAAVRLPASGSGALSAAARASPPDGSCPDCFRTGAFAAPGTAGRLAAAGPAFATVAAAFAGTPLRPLALAGVRPAAGLGSSGAGSVAAGSWVGSCAAPAFAGSAPAVAGCCAPGSAGWGVFVAPAAGSADFSAGAFRRTAAAAPSAAATGGVPRVSEVAAAGADLGTVVSGVPSAGAAVRFTAAAPGRAVPGSRRAPVDERACPAALFADASAAGASAAAAGSAGPASDPRRCAGSWMLAGGASWPGPDALLPGRTAPVAAVPRRRPAGRALPPVPWSWPDMPVPSCSST